MPRRESIDTLVGVIVFIIVASLLNLIYNYDFSMTIIVVSILAIIFGLIIDCLQRRK